MRGIGHAFWNFPAAHVILAGAAFIAGATVSKAYAEADDTAFALPRVSPDGRTEVMLPQPLEPGMAVRFQRVFALQARGDIAAAVRESEGLDIHSPLGAGLFGHVLADRFLNPHYRASIEELTDWLNRYPTLPDAPAIRALLLRRQPHTAAPPSPPQATAASPAASESMAVINDAFEPSFPRNPALDQTVRVFSRDGNPGRALRLLARTKGLTPLYGATLRAELARAAFAANKDATARALAAAAWHQSRGEVGLAAYVAGLVAWREDRPAEAARWFDAAAGSVNAPKALVAAGNFWAARAHRVMHDAEGARVRLERAASVPRSFYGILAARLLKRLHSARGFGVLGEADVEAIAATEEGSRAFALLQIHQSKRAGAELRQLLTRSQNTPGLQGAVLRVAEAAELFDVTAEFGPLVQRGGDGPVTVQEISALPVPHLAPRSGFCLNPALIYALARLESNFDASATSPKGAQGLLQIRPLTAEFLASMSKTQAARPLLRDPAVNLELGQRYLLHLAGLSDVRGDLLRLLGSYNAGPSAFAHWAAAIRDKGDPLLFIEAIPAEQTRLYLQRVLVYTWLYAARLGLSAPSLEALAEGRFPQLSAEMRPGSKRAAVQKAAYH
ncbi:MAG: transglycosylase SLT domain-containing protein [Acetobacteraceae bacterium]|nr:transglycosylase SLT domain-containing protein [Acetobacteraceae bacterium]